MPGLIRRTLLIGAAAAAAGGLASWALRPRAATEIAYGTGPRQVMDLTLPGTAGPHPVLLMIHGGGFRTGDKTDLAIWPELTEAGIAVARLSTRRSDTDRWPAPAEDCLAAVVHLQRAGADIGIDPARLVLLGQSSGAFLAVSTALSLVEVGLPPKGVISLYGPMDFSTMDQDMATLGRTPALGPTDAADSAESLLLGFPIGQDRAAARAISPLARLDRLREPLPPLLIRHGDADPMVADLQARRLREAWIAADPKAQIDYKLVPGAGHGGAAFETDPVKAEILAFLQSVLA